MIITGLQFILAIALLLFIFVGGFIGFLWILGKVIG